MAENLSQAQEIANLTTRATDLFMAIVALEVGVGVMESMIIQVPDEIDMSMIGIIGTIPRKMIEIRPFPPLGFPAYREMILEFWSEWTIAVDRLFQLGVPWSLSPPIEPSSIVEAWNQHHEPQYHLSVSDFHAPAGGDAGASKSRTVAPPAVHTDKRPKPRGRTKR